MFDVYLPALLWAIITGISLIVVLLALGIYLWYRRRVEAVVSDASKVAELAAKKDQLEAEIEQCRKWLEDNREELLKLDAERRQQELLRQELADHSIKLAQEEQKLAEIRKEATDLQNVVSTLAQDRDRLDGEKATLERKKAEADAGAKVAEELRQKTLIEAEQAQKDLEDKRREMRELNAKITDQSLKKEALVEEIHHKETRLQEFENALKEAQSRTEEIQKIEKVLSEKRSELSTLEDKIKEERQKHSTLMDKALEAEHRVRELEARCAMLEEKIGGTDGKGQDPYESLYQPPEIFTNTGLDLPHVDHTEDQALEDLKNYLKECKLVFPMRVLKAFHTSLKIADISPLVVMAGISGTGKSELPRRYAEALGMHFLLMAVQPRWDSPQDMFGFYNYLEHRYKATELARCLVCMDKWNSDNKAGYADRVLLVLLDEMNLARVEYYFSEFLSKLEIRRSINPDDPGERMKAEISLDVGSHAKELKVPRLYAHENVLFVGTMNEDESTQTLSDKVIDRANVLRFGRPEKMFSSKPGIPQRPHSKFLPFSIWKDWYKKDDFLNPHVRKEVEGWIGNLNLALDDIGRPFGYRINQAIFSYIANYPGVNAQNNHRLAFADQLEQRVLPKLRGLDINMNKACFETIREVMDELGDKELDEAYQKAMSKSDVLFSWYGVTRKLDQ